MPSPRRYDPNDLANCWCICTEYAYTCIYSGPRLAEILALSNWVSHPMNLAFLNIRAYIANGFDRHISGIHKFEKNRLCS